MPSVANAPIFVNRWKAVARSSYAVNGGLAGATTPLPVADRRWGE